MNSRIFKVSPKNKQSQLSQQYGCLDGFSHGWLNDEITHGLSISYFDHWLRNDEHHILDNVTKEEHIKRAKCFHSFYSELSKYYKLYSYRLHGKRKIKMQFREFNSRESMFRYFSSANYLMGKGAYPKLLIPECNAVIHESYNYTALIGFKSKSDISQVLTQAKNNGLHILEWHD